MKWLFLSYERTHTLTHTKIKLRFKNVEQTVVNLKLVFNLVASVTKKKNAP